MAWRMTGGKRWLSARRRLGQACRELLSHRGCRWHNHMVKQPSQLMFKAHSSPVTAESRTTHTAWFQRPDIHKNTHKLNNIKAFI